MTLFRFLVVAGLIFVSSAISQEAKAVTQCQVTVLRVWAGTDGVVWLDFSNNTSAGISPDSLGRDQIMSLAMTAIATGRSVIVRYQADNANCNVSRNDFVGLYII